MEASTNTLLQVRASLSDSKVTLPDPSEFEWGLQDVSASDSGRTQDATMHKKRVAQKRTIQLGWNYPSRAKCAQILQAVNPEYIYVTYPDLMSGEQEERQFYVGDRTAPYKTWWNGFERVSKLAFKLIER